MTCIHTGAEVHLNQYGEAVRCDIHRIGECAVLRITSTARRSCGWDPQTMYQVRHVGDGWFGKGDDTSTLVVPLYKLILPENGEDAERWSGIR